MKNSDKFDIKRYLKENKFSLIEGRFDTAKKRENFIKKNKIVTFKKKIAGRKQCVIENVKKSGGKVKLEGPFGYETPWFESMDKLINAIDWNWMEKNI